MGRACLTVPITTQREFNTVHQRGRSGERKRLEGEEDVEGGVANGLGRGLLTKIDSRRRPKTKGKNQEGAKGRPRLHREMLGG